MLQDVRECYTVLHSVTEYNIVLQNIAEYYRVFLAHLLGPIPGLVVIRLPSPHGVDPLKKFVIDW